MSIGLFTQNFNFDKMDKLKEHATKARKGGMEETGGSVAKGLFEETGGSVASTGLFGGMSSSSNSSCGSFSQGSCSMVA